MQPLAVIIVAGTLAAAIAFAVINGADRVDRHALRRGAAPRPDGQSSIRGLDLRDFCPLER